MDIVAGKLLIAIPELPDSNFFRTVVFMVEHSAEGSMGVIINRPTEVQINKIWEQLAPDVLAVRDDEIHIGGPVKGPILGLHNQFKLTDTEVIDGVYMTMSSDRLNHLVALPKISLRLFSGYSGWGPGQLELEISSGGWLVTDAKPVDIFGEADNLWKNVCERFGQEIMFHAAGDSHTNGDPNLN